MREFDHKYLVCEHWRMALRKPLFVDRPGAPAPNMPGRTATRGPFNWNLAAWALLAGMAGFLLGRVNLTSARQRFLRRLYAPEPLYREAAPSTAPIPLRHVRFPGGSNVVVSSAGNPWFDGWWQNDFPTWEPRTFRVFAEYLREGDHFSTYVGFGEWIGPTVLYAAPFVTRAFAIEPDPNCRAALRESVAANPSIADHTFVSSFCISNASGTLLMRGAGGSGSFLDGLVDAPNNRKYAADNPSLWFSVHCLPLAAFFEEHGIAISGSTFVKVDSEGAEWVVVPSLHAMLSMVPQGQARPTFFISVHLNEQRPQSADGFVSVARLFKYAAIPLGDDARQPSSGLAAEFTKALLDAFCPQACDVVLSDLKPPGGGDFAVP